MFETDPLSRTQSLAGSLGFHFRFTLQTADGKQNTLKLHPSAINTYMNINYQWKIFTQKQFNDAKWQTKLPIKCSFCGKTVLRTKQSIDNSTNLKHIKHLCCSASCGSSLRDTRETIKCKQCKNPFKATAYQRKTKRAFCSQSCFGTFNNTHKTSGYRRSKLEYYIEQNIRKDFPELLLLVNDIKTINLELDFYIPQLRLAFEINGIFHYEPIYSHDSLSKIQTRDKQKLI